MQEYTLQPTLQSATNMFVPLQLDISLHINDEGLQQTLLLASGCTEFYMPPCGVTSLTGLSCVLAMQA
jgi:hypothetical protein